MQPRSGKDLTLPFAEQEVRAELNRILSSPEFRNADRLTSLLRHVVDRTLEGATHCLKESLLGREVFDRSDFDPRIDPIVRVEASRLRKRLDDFYRRSGWPLGIAIGLPRGNYVASFDRQEPGAALAQVSESHAVRRLAVVPLGRGAGECSNAAGELIHHAIRRTAFTVVPWTAATTETESEALRIAAASEIDLLICVTERQSSHDACVCFRATDVRKTVYLASEECLVGNSRETAVGRFLDQLEGRTGSTGVRRAPSAAAYNLYLKGRYHWNIRTEAGLWKAVEYFRQSIAEDPGCALGCAGLADAYTLLANYGAVAADEVRPKAKEYALRAMEIDASLAEAHTSLAHVHATYEWDWQTSELEYLTAIRMDPSYATAHHWYAITLLTPLCRLDEALEEMRRARECDAISPSIRRDEGLVQLYSGNAEAAHDTVTHLLALDTRFSGAWWLMGLIAESQARYEVAVQSFQRSVELSARHPRMLGSLGHAFAMAGLTAEAEAVLSELEGMCADRYVSPFHVALVHVGLGRHDTAFSFLSRAVSQRSYDLVTLQVDLRYGALRPLAAYEQLLRTIGLTRAQRLADI